MRDHERNKIVGLPGLEVVVYSTGPECTLCQHVLDLLDALRARLAIRFELQIRVVELSLSESLAPPDARDAALEPDFVFRAPVVMVAGRVVLEGRISRESLIAALSEVNSSFARAVAAIPSNAACGPGAPRVDERI